MNAKHKKMKIGILKRLEGFRSTGEEALPAYVPKEMIQVGQTPLGVYENVRDSGRNAILFTDTSIWIEQSGELIELRYSDMKSVRTSPESKRSANSLVIVDTSGAKHVVKVTGKNSDGADVFAVQKFLLYAIPH